MLCESTTSGTTVSPNVCQINRCLNGGTCQAVPGGGYVCHCVAGFIGVRCDIPTGNFHNNEIICFVLFPTDIFFQDQSL